MGCHRSGRRVPGFRHQHDVKRHGGVCSDNAGDPDARAGVGDALSPQAGTVALPGASVTQGQQY